ncbi:hypothetical protein Tco_1290163 [Tanacetum coccineum]
MDGEDHVEELLDWMAFESRFRGELLTSMGRDTNNQMFPMAWAAVNIENSKNWVRLRQLENYYHVLSINYVQGTFIQISKEMEWTTLQVLVMGYCIIDIRVVAYSFLNQDVGIRVSSWFSKQMLVDAYSYFIKPVGGSSMWVKSANPPPLPPRRGLCQEKGCNKARCYNQTRPKPQQEKRKPGRKSKNDTYQPFNPPNDGSGQSNVNASADPHIVPNVDPHTDQSADPSVSNTNVADPTSNQSLTSLLNTRMDAEITDAKIVALSEMNEVEEREAIRKDGERVLEDAKRMGVYRKRGAGGFREPSERIRNQKKKKEDPNGLGKQPDTTLDSLS